MPPLPPDLGAETIKHGISLLRLVSITCSAISGIKPDGVPFKTHDKRHFNPVYMESHDFQRTCGYLFVGSGINFARSAMKTALFIRS